MVLLLKNVLFTLIVPGTVAVYAPLVMMRGRPITTAAPWLVAGAILLALGAAIYFWCVWDFASSGRGTPLPSDAPRRLVVRGPYRYTRNPMYVGVIAAIAGWAAIFAASWLLAYALFVALACHLFVVLYEEPKLRALFPGEYGAYCREVGRWIPRLPKKPDA